jgi:hypothetical protein
MIKIKYDALWIINFIMCYLSHYPKGGIYITQIIVLCINTILFMVQVVGELEKTSNLKDDIKLFKLMSRDGKFILEYICLMCGWIFIFYKRGIAVFRCFRVFRLLWFIIYTTMIYYMWYNYNGLYLSLPLLLC